MPLLDHFRPPLSKQRPWEGFHSTWATCLADVLNHGGLPKGYIALPRVRLGGHLEIDVATLEEDTSEDAITGASPTTAVYAPPRPLLSTEIDFGDLDAFEVRVYREDVEPMLVAAIELVRPANKDRPAQRRAFAVKCAGYLQQGMGLLIVDVVTTRTNSLHRELIRLLQMENSARDSSADSQNGPNPDLYASGYRTAPYEHNWRFEVWLETLTVGSVLPSMPLWISESISVEARLEESYAAACRTLLIPQS